MSSPTSKPSVDPRNITTSLAYDVASGLLDAEALMEKYSMTEAEMMAILATEEFRTLHREAKLLWESDVDKRLEAKARMSLEDNLLTLHSMANDPTIDPQARISALKLLAGVAGATASKSEGASGGERVVVNINIPATPDTPGQTINVEAQALPPTPDFSEEDV